MKTAVAIVRQDKDDESGLRLALRDALEFRKQCAIRLAKTEAAIAKAEAHVDDSTAKLELVQAATARAREKFASQTAAAITKGTAAPPATTLQNARTAELETQDQVNAAHAAHAQIEVQLAALHDEIAAADSRALTAANAILAEPMRQAFEEAKKLQAELLKRRAILQALYANNAPAFRDEIRAFNAKEERDKPLAEIKSIPELKNFVHMRIGAGIDKVAEAKAAAAYKRWKAARAALMIDPDAPVPEL